MHFLYGLLTGFAVGGSAIGYLAYNYGKKVTAAVAAAQKA